MNCSTHFRTQYTVLKLYIFFKPLPICRDRPKVYKQQLLDICNYFISVFLQTLTCPEKICPMILIVCCASCAKWNYNLRAVFV